MIKIIDNFFDDEKYRQVMYHIKNNIYFTPRYFDESKEKTKENFYGERFVLNSDKLFLKTFIKQAEKKFNLKIKELSSDCAIDLRNIDEWKPHTDTELGKINILIMLDGPIGVNSGTVFYTNKELDMHIGFRPNRAILFPSNKFHSPHKSNFKNMKRYTSTLFINDYERSI